jgi:peroxiredoxin
LVLLAGLPWLAACNRADRVAPVVSSDKEKQACFAWNFQTLVTPYQTAGFANRAWDEPAVRALTEFARLRAQAVASNEPALEIVGTNCELARKSGCQDPMIAYLHTRFYLAQTNSKEAFMAAYSNAATRLEASSYPPLRKFYGWLRLGDQIVYTYGYGTNIPARVHELGAWRNAKINLHLMVQDQSILPEEIYDACHQYMEYWKNDKDIYSETYELLQGPLFANWPNASPIWLLKGEVFVEKAWGARGIGFADTVTEEGWKGFEKMLHVAEGALDRAWELNPKDPRIATTMLTLEMGQGKGRERMETWFRRAIDLDPNNYDACQRKLLYLQPKWHGSLEDMLAFGWECAESPNWGGKVPLTLFDARVQVMYYTKHFQGEKFDASEYWKQPEVWPDIQEAFEKFFQLNPEATGWYHDYALYAYRCERWQALNRLLPKLGKVNYDFFGGQAEFDKMARLAKQHAGETDPQTNAFRVDIYRWNAKLASRVNRGLTNESDFQDLLKTCDTVIAQHDTNENEIAAQVLLAKAQLYQKVFGNFSKAGDLVRQLKQDFPQTEPGRHADEILDALEKEEKAAKIRAALAVGKTFPEFSEQDLSGKPLSLAQFKGKVLLVDFWATWCPPCVAELPNVRKIYEAHHNQGFEIIGVSLDQDRDKLEEFINKQNLAWPQYFDGQGWTNKLAAKCAIDSIPATFLLDGSGKIIGADLRGNALEDAVREALKSK